MEHSIFLDSEKINSIRESLEGRLKTEWSYFSWDTSLGNKIHLCYSLNQS